MTSKGFDDSLSNPYPLTKWGTRNETFVPNYEAKPSILTINKSLCFTGNYAREHMVVSYVFPKEGMAGKTSSAIQHIKKHSIVCKDEKGRLYHLLKGIPEYILDSDLLQLDSHTALLEPVRNIKPGNFIEPSGGDCIYSEEDLQSCSENYDRDLPCILLHKDDKYAYVKCICRDLYAKLKLNHPVLLLSLTSARLLAELREKVGREKHVDAEQD